MCARTMARSPCACSHCCATSRPKTKETPRGLATHPVTCAEGSAHSRSDSRPSPLGLTSWAAAGSGRWQRRVRGASRRQRSDSKSSRRAPETGSGAAGPCRLPSPAHQRPADGVDVVGVVHVRRDAAVAQEDLAVEQRSQRQRVKGLHHRLPHRQRGAALALAAEAKEHRDFGALVVAAQQVDGGGVPQLERKQRGHNLQAHGACGQVGRGGGVRHQLGGTWQAQGEHRPPRAGDPATPLAALAPAPSSPHPCRCSRPGTPRPCRRCRGGPAGGRCGAGRRTGREGRLPPPRCWGC